MKSIRKHTQNVIVNTLSLLCFVILSITGVMIKFKLPAGSRGATVLGFTRHEWGDFHFWMALALVVTITVHLLLHIPWIKGSFHAQDDNIKRIKVMAFTVTFILIIVAGIIALASPVID